MWYQQLSEIDIEKTLQDLFCFVGQDMVSETTFRALLNDWDVLAHQAESYTILLRMWEEHGYITVLRVPGKERYVERGRALEPNYLCL